MIELAGGGGGAFGVTPASLDSAASSLAGVGQSVDSDGQALVAALASAQGSLGDPDASSAMSEVLSAWILPLGELGSLVLRASQTTLHSSAAYSDTDTVVGDAAR